jgi:hypothetical protein
MNRRQKHLMLCLGALEIDPVVAKTQTVALIEWAVQDQLRTVGPP